MNAEFEFNAEYLEECFKRRKKLEERIYPKKDWPVGYEPTKKEYEEWMEEGTGIPVSYHEEDIGGGRKRCVFTPIKKNMEILSGFEKVAKEIGLENGGVEHPVSFEIKGRDGNLTKVSKEEFAKWMVDDKKQVEKPKESLVYGAKGDINGLTYFTERKGPDGVFKESYYEPRSEEEKQQIRERQELNKKKREKENSLVAKPETTVKAIEDKKNENPKAKIALNSSDKQEEKLDTSQSSKSYSSSSDQNNNCFGTITLLVSLLLGVSLAGYGISFVIRKRNKKNR